VLGNGHGHDPAFSSATSTQTKGSRLAIHDSDVIVSGTYSGHPTSITAAAPSLQFPGVHSLYQVICPMPFLHPADAAVSFVFICFTASLQDNVLLPTAQQTNEGLFGSANGGTGGFIAWLVD
jgi:hypothetical protein